MDLKQKEFKSFLNEAFGLNKEGSGGEPALSELCMALFEFQFVKKKGDWVRKDRLAKLLLYQNDFESQEVIRHRVRRIRQKFKSFFTDQRLKEYGYQVLLGDDKGYRKKTKKASSFPMISYRLEIKPFNQKKLIEPKSKAILSRFNISIARLNRKFYGREQYISEIEKNLFSPGSIALSICGLSGIGKTQLAVEYAYSYKEYYPGGCFWIQVPNSAEKKHRNLIASLNKLQFPLGLEIASDLPEEQKTEIILNELRQETRQTLIIFDNVDSLKIIQNVLHSLSSHHLLITTTNPKLSPHIKCLNLEPISQDASIEFLLSCCKDGNRIPPKTGTKEFLAVQSIADRLNGLPLALEIASSFLYSNPKIKYSDYYKRLLSEGSAEVLDSNDLTFNSHDASIKATLKPVWNKIEKDPDLVNLLSKVAYFSNEPIGKDLLIKTTGIKNKSNEPKKSKTLDFHINKVKQLGLVEITEDEKVVCHQVIRDFIKSQLTSELKKENCRAVARILFSRLDKKPWNIDKLLKYAINNWEHFEEILFELYLNKIDKEFLQSFFYLGILYSTVPGNELGRFVLDSTLRIIKGDNYEHEYELEKAILFFLEMIDRFKEKELYAKRYYGQVLEFNHENEIKEFNKIYPLIFLGNCFEEIGENGVAKLLFTKALGITQTQKRFSDFDLLYLIYIRLGETSKKHKDYELALGALDNAIEIENDHKNFENVSDALNLKFSVLIEMENFIEAQPLIEEIFERYINKFGKDNPNSVGLKEMVAETRARAKKQRKLNIKKKSRG